MSKSEIRKIEDEFGLLPSKSKILLDIIKNCLTEEEQHVMEKCYIQDGNVIDLSCLFYNELNIYKKIYPKIKKYVLRLDREILYSSGYLEALKEISIIKDEYQASSLSSSSLTAIRFNKKLSISSNAENTKPKVGVKVKVMPKVKTSPLLNKTTPQKEVVKSNVLSANDENKPKEDEKKETPSLNSENKPIEVVNKENAPTSKNEDTKPRAVAKVKLAAGSKTSSYLPYGNLYKSLTKKPTSTRKYSNLHKCIECNPTYKEILNAVKLLSSKDQELTFDYCGLKFDGINSKPLSDAEINHFENTIFPLINKIILKERDKDEDYEINSKKNSRNNNKTTSIKDNKEEKLNQKKEEKKEIRKTKKNLVIRYGLPSEEIKKLMPLFRKETQDRIYEYCGDNLDGHPKREISQKEWAAFTILKKLDQIVDQVKEGNHISEEKIEKYVNGKNNGDKKYTVTTSNLVLRYKLSCEEIKKTFIVFTENGIKTIYEYCGDNLDGHPKREFTKKEKQAFRINRITVLDKVIAYSKEDDCINEEKVKEYIKSIRKPINTKPVLNLVLRYGLPYKELKKVLILYSKEEIKEIYDYCGDKLDGISKIELSAYDKVLFRSKRIVGFDKIIEQTKEDECINDQKIDEYIKRKKAESNSATSNLILRYELSCEEIKKVFKAFSEKSQEIFYEYCGDNLDGHPKREYTKNEKNSFRANQLQSLDKIIASVKEEDHINEQKLSYYVNTKKIKDKRPTANLVLRYKLSCEEIKKTIKIFSKTKVNLIYEYCGDNLDGNSKREFIRKEKVYFRANILRILDKVIENSKEEDYINEKKLDNYIKQNKTAKDQKSTTNLVLRYDLSCEVLKRIIKVFNENKQSLIYEYCGDNIDGHPKRDFTRKEKTYLRSSILRTLDEIINNIKEDSYINDDKLNNIINHPKKKEPRTTTNLILRYDLTYEEIQKALKAFSENKQKKIYEYCGDDLDGHSKREFNEKEKLSFRANILGELDKIIEYSKKEECISEKKIDDYIKQKKQNKKRKSTSDLNSRYNLSLEEIQKALKAFSENKQKQFYEYCGDNLDGHPKRKFTPKEEKCFKTSKLKLLDEIIEYSKENDHIDDKKLNEFIEQKLPKDINTTSNLTLRYGLSCEEIKKVLKVFNSKNQNIIYEYCGDDLDGKSKRKFTKSEKINYRVNIIKLIDNVIAYAKEDECINDQKIDEYIKRKKAESNSSTSNLILRYDLSCEEIKKVFKAFSEKNQEIFYEYCGDNLDGHPKREYTKNEKSSFRANQLQSLDKIIASVKEEDHINEQKLSYYVNTKKIKDKRPTANLVLRYNLSCEEIKKIIDTLSPKRQTSIYEYCGDNLDGHPKREFTLKEKASFRANSLKLLDEIIGIPKKENPTNEIKTNNYIIPNYLEDNSEKEIKQVIEEQAENTYENNNDLTKLDYKEMKKIFGSTQFQELLDYGFTNIEAVILALSNGSINRSFTITKIAQFLNVNISYVKEILIKSINRFNDNFRVEADNYINELAKRYDDENK